MNYKLTYKIINYQKELYDLEINGLKNSNKYNYIIHELKQLIKEEELFFKNLVISETKLENEIDKCFDKISNHDEFIKSYYRRILYFLTNILSKQTIKKLNEIFISKKDTMVSDGSNMKDKLFTCLGLIYFSTLNEYINDLAYSNIKNKLVEKKYTFSLIYPELEEKMLNYNFDVPNSIYNDLFFEGQLSDIPIPISSRLLDAQLLTFVEDYTVELTRPNKLKKEDIVNNICLIRSSITLMSDKTRNCYFEIVSSLLDDKDLQMNEEQKQYLLESIGNYNKDMKKIKIISLGIQLQ